MGIGMGGGAQGAGPPLISRKQLGNTLHLTNRAYMQQEHGVGHYNWLLYTMPIAFERELKFIVDCAPPATFNLPTPMVM